MDLLEGLVKAVEALTCRCLHREAQWCIDLIGHIDPFSVMFQAQSHSLRMVQAKNLFALKQFRAAEMALYGEPGPAAGFLRCYYRWIAIDLEGQLGKGHRGPDFIQVGDAAAIQIMLSELLEIIKETMNSLGDPDSYLLWLYQSPGSV